MKKCVSFNCLFLLLFVLFFSTIVQAIDLQTVRTINFRPIPDTAPAGLTGAIVFPGDVDGDGETDFLVKAGGYWMGVYDLNGNKYWETTKYGEVCYETTASVWDLDGDGKDEVIGTMKDASGQDLKLHVYNGQTGAVQATYQTRAPNAYRTKVAIGYIDNINVPRILLKDLDDESGLEIGARVTAFDRHLNVLWNYDVDRGGHGLHPYDLDGDGIHEVCAGKYIIDGNGSLLYTLSGWGSDHVDALAVADIHPGYTGLEIVASGTSGVRLYRAQNGALIWEIRDNQPISDAQQVFVGDLDSSNPGLEIWVTERWSNNPRYQWTLDYNGNTVHQVQIQNGVPNDAPVFVGDVDGDRSEFDMMHLPAEIRTVTGTVRETTSWFDPNADEISWCSSAFTMDILGDAREEVIVWNKNCIKIGQNQDSFGGGIPSFRNDRQYRLRLSGARQLFRGELFFDYGQGDDPVNIPPTVNAGSDQSIMFPIDTVTLNGTVTDPDDKPSISWSKESGPPGAVIFGDSSQEDTTATFPQAGTYVLKLTADDSVNPSVSDTVTITVSADSDPPAKPTGLRIVSK